MMIHTAPPPAIYYHLVAAQSEVAANPLQSPYEDRSKYSFTYTWFEQVRPDWEQHTAHLVGRPLNILEIGSFEGCSTTWLLDHLMDHEASTLTAVDTFGGGNESAPSEYDISQLEQRFRSNVRLAKNGHKTRIMKGTSPDILVQLRAERAEFDLIYIDGSHMAVDVLQDAMLAFPMLKEYGTIVFDDYRWGLYKQEYYNPNVAITSFLRCAAPTLSWVEHNGQIWAQKVPNWSPPERREY